MTGPAYEGMLARRRIMVVEDEYFIADDMAKALERLGAEIVGPVPTRDQALALLKAGPVDAAVLDINLKRQTVYPVADALREHGVPFVFATGLAEGVVLPAYQDVPLWEKPFKPESLAQALPSLIQTLGS
ncbi:response regulator [Microvirga calopogonii]|uniref:response regulator n=1 Tax=Microvirga calopogonii TaxID=2078013 RepID=UPI000E0DEDB3|nr:response regulator [Microvirga calopogonii]